MDKIDTGAALAENFSCLVDSSDCILIFDEDGCVRSACAGTEPLLGVEPNSIIGQTFQNTELNIFGSDGKPLGPQDHPFAKAKRVGQSLNDVPLTVVRPTGDKIGVLADALPLRDSVGQLVGVALSLTEQGDCEEAQEELRASEARFQAVFYRAAVGIALADSKGRSLRVNPALQAILGYSEQELQSMTFLDFTHPEDVKANAGLFEELLAGDRESYELEKRYITKDGRVIWGHVSSSIVRGPNGEPLLSLGVVEDITERKHAELELIASEERYRSLAENAHDNIFIYGDGCFQYVNGRVAELMGGRPEDIIGRSHRELLPPDTAEKLDSRVEAILESGEAMSVETLIPFPGQGMWVNTRLVPLKDEHGRAYAVMGIGRDVTQRRQAEDESRKFQAALLAVPPSIGGIEFGHIYHSATEAALVGGDFYDAFEITEGIVGITVGDVSGKGIEAATLASQVRSTIRAYAHQGDDPASAIAKTSKVILESSPELSTFVTAFFGTLDTSSGDLTYCSAGQPQALVKRASTVSTLLTRSPVLGVATDLEFVCEKASLEKGDIVVLYTDGITEARSGSNFFGKNRLLELASRIDAGASQFPKQVIEAVNAFTDGTLSDDVALIAFSLANSPS